MDLPYSDPDKQRDWQKHWARDWKRWFWEFKATLSCSRCGFSHPAAMQFHHNGDKELGVSRMVTRRYNREKILAEIAKCEVLCANCHAVEHHSEYEAVRPA